MTSKVASLFCGCGGSDSDALLQEDQVGRRRKEQERKELAVEVGKVVDEE